MGRYGLFRVLAGAAVGALAGVLVGIVAWCIIHSLAGISPFEIPDETLLGAIVTFLMPIGLLGLSAGLFVGMVLPRRGKTPPSLVAETASLVPEKYGCLAFIAFSAACMVALVGGCVAVNTAIGNFPVTSQDDWPRPLKELLEDADQRRVKLEQIKVYHTSSFLEDPTYFWQTKDSAGALALMTERWRLLPMDKSDTYIAPFWEEMPWRYAAPAIPIESTISQIATSTPSTSSCATRRGDSWSFGVASGLDGRLQ